jgi:hypothetical protein
MHNRTDGGGHRDHWVNKTRPSQDTSQPEVLNANFDGNCSSSCDGSSTKDRDPVSKEKGQPVSQHHASKHQKTRRKY